MLISLLVLIDLILWLQWLPSSILFHSISFYSKSSFLILMLRISSQVLIIFLLLWDKVLVKLNTFDTFPQQMSSLFKVLWKEESWFQGFLCFLHLQREEYLYFILKVQKYNVVSIQKLYFPRDQVLREYY